MVRRFALTCAIYFSFLSFAFAGKPACSAIHLMQFEQSPEVSALVLPDAFAQWRLWEQIANHFKHRKTTELVEFESSIVPYHLVKIWKSSRISEKVSQFFLRKSGVLWIKHLFNRDSRLPFFDEPVAEKVSMNLMASRSANPENVAEVTVKLPTDYPSGVDREREPEKLDNREDIQASILRMQHIERIDSEIGSDPEFFIQPEILGIYDEVSKNGALVRDISKLQDGHYYLPALAIPYVGREIAKINGQSFEKFWKQNYAMPLGRVKAKLLLRYGLEMVTPNAQNFLIQLNRHLEPTGVIIVRDIADTRFIKPVALALGFVDSLKQEEQAELKGLPFGSKLNPYFKNSVYLFDEAGDKSVSRRTLHAWEQAHDREYIAYIEETYNVKFSKSNAWLSYWRDQVFGSFNPFRRVEKFLFKEDLLKDRRSETN